MMAATPALADFELSFYGGLQSAPHSRVWGTAPDGGGDFDFIAGWQGRPLEMPPYWGIRATLWQPSDWGWSLDFAHAKVYADDETLGPGGTSGGFEVLEFTDGLNILTINLLRRWPGAGRLTPYGGLGLGITVPHVEVTTPGALQPTFGYQFAGYAVQWQAGVSWQLANPRWALFGEYKGNVSFVDANLDGGGTLRSNIVTNAVNIGVSYRF